MTTAAPRYRIGIDGGGTKTELILVDPAGAIIARHVGPGCNPSHLGPDQARATLLAAIDALLASAPDPSARTALAGTHLFMAGSPQFWREFATATPGLGTITSAPDSLPVLELATDGAPGLVLHAGTGSFVAARGLDGVLHYAGGLGWRLGDPASGTDLGRRGVAHALLEIQGWAAPSPLGEALRTHTGLPGADAGTLVRFLYNAPDVNARIGTFAPHVLQAASAGHATARALVAASVTDLVDQAMLVTTKLFPGRTVPCGVCGILTREPAADLVKEITAARSWAVDLRFVTAAPIEGVRRLVHAAAQG